MHKSWRANLIALRLLGTTRSLRKLFFYTNLTCIGAVLLSINPGPFYWTAPRHFPSLPTVTSLTIACTVAQPFSIISILYSSLSPMILFFKNNTFQKPPRCPCALGKPHHILKDRSETPYLFPDIRGREAVSMLCIILQVSIFSSPYCGKHGNFLSDNKKRLLGESFSHRQPFIYSTLFLRFKTDSKLPSSSSTATAF